MKNRSTQNFVPIKEIRDGVVILKSGAMVSILMASSLNFALKSGDEQMATIAQFQNFLNSLDFSVQFFVESRELDIRPYITLLEGRYDRQINDLMRIQTREYIEFIRSFTRDQNIMTKHFFIAMPYYPPSLKPEKGIMKLFGGSGNNSSKNTGPTQFEENLSQLEQRIAIVSQGLMSSGVRTIPLGTEELIELFYKIFNPGDLEKPLSMDQ